MAILYVTYSSDNNAGRKPVREVPPSALNTEEVAITKAESLQDTSKQMINTGHENRRYDMQATFLKLQQSRKQLKSSANLLKSKIWGLKLPAEQARTVSKKMRQAYAYLKNPPMLGAYFEMDEIHHELRKVEAMQESLNEIEQIITASQNGEG